MKLIYFNTLCVCVAAIPALVVFSFFPNRVGGAGGILVFLVTMAFCNKTLRGI